MIQGYMDITECPNCHSKELIPKGIYVAAPVVLANMNGMSFMMLTQCTFVTCKECGLHIQSPRLTDYNLFKFYTEGVYSATLGMIPETVDEIEKNRAVKMADFLDDVEFASHLDFGASRGYFLDMTYARFGAKSVGVDLYGKYAEVEPMPCELVSSVHTLEHCPNPKLELKKYRKYCEKYLLLVVPRSVSHAFRMAHLFAFPEETLLKMVEEADFKVIKIDTNEQEIRMLAEVV